MKLWPALSVALILAAFGLSVHRLGEESIWVDEGVTLKAAQASTWEIFPIQIAADDYNPPLPFLLWHYWILYLGSTEFSARLLSALAALVASALCYKLGEEIFDPATGLLGSLLVVSSGFHIYYAQMIRGYSLLEMFTLLSWYSAVRIYRRASFNFLMAYILGSVALLYTHYYGVFVLLGQNLFFGILLVQLWRSPGPPNWRLITLKIKNWFIPQAIIAASFVPWIPVLMLRAPQAVTIIERPSLGSVVGPFIEFTWSPIGFVLAMCLAFVGIYVLVRPAVLRRTSVHKSLMNSHHNLPVSIEGPASSRHPAVLAAIWLLCLWAVPLCISFLAKPIFYSRYMIAALPAFYLLLAWLALRVVRPAFGLPLAGLIVVAQLSGVHSLYNSVNNEQWRAAVPYLEAQARSGDLLLFYAGIGQFSYEYYSQRNDLIKAGLGVSAGPAKTQIIVSETKPAVVWLVLVYRSGAEFDDGMTQLGYFLAEQHSFFRINLLKYQKIDSLTTPETVSPQNILSRTGGTP